MLVCCGVEGNKLTANLTAYFQKLYLILRGFLTVETVIQLLWFLWQLKI